jgi:hypothetical protein
MRAIFRWPFAIALAVLSAGASASPAETDPALRAFRASRCVELEAELSSLFAVRSGTYDQTFLFDEAIRRLAKAVDLDSALAANLAAWERAFPQSARPALVRAEIELRRGWRVRGGGLGDTVPEAAWPIFRAHVGKADALLSRAQRLAPKDPALAVWRIETALLGGAGAEQIAERFASALEIDPTSVAAHRAMMRVLEPRWLGSGRGALEFARAAAARNPQDSTLGLILLEAHASIAWRADSSPPQRSTYFRQPDVWNEAFPVLERYVREHPTDPWGHNRLAWLAWRGGRREIAKRQLEGLAGDYRDDAWDSDVSPEQARLWARLDRPPAVRPRGAEPRAATSGL